MLSAINSLFGFKERQSHENEPLNQQSANPRTVQQVGPSAQMMLEQQRQMKDAAEYQQKRCSMSDEDARQTEIVKLKVTMAADLAEIERKNTALQHYGSSNAATMTYMQKVQSDLDCRMLENRVVYLRRRYENCLTKLVQLTRQAK